MILSIRIISAMTNSTQIWKLAMLIPAVALIQFLVRGSAGAMRPDAELKVAVNATTMESFPAFMAAESLGTGDHVHSVRLVLAPNGRAAMAQLVSGAVDAATGSEMQGLLNSAADPRIRVVVTLAECRYRIVAR